MKENVFFVSGIDTNVGKSYAAGYLAKVWNEQGSLVLFSVRSSLLLSVLGLRYIHLHFII